MDADDSGTAQTRRPKRAAAGGPREVRTRFAYYSGELLRLFRLHIPTGSSVLEIGIRQEGDLLAALRPSRGTGLDPDPEIIRRSAARNPGLNFIQGDPVSFDLGGETFDYVVISNALAGVADVQALFQRVHRVCHPATRIVVAYHNALWEPALALATFLGLRVRTEPQNWLSVQDLMNLLVLADLDLVRRSTETLLPLRVPILTGFFNRFLVRFWPFTHFGLVSIMIARPARATAVPENPKVSVVIPCRNERGNVEPAIRRTPEMGGGTEIIFVDGNSTDGTVEEIEIQTAAHSDRRIRLILQGDGTGKGDAVRKGFAAATGDILMILDADLTVPPEYLPRFADVLVGGKGEFVNGTRLVYPMERQAMRFLNKAGNRFFSIVFTWLLSQPLRDTLCGTKVLSRSNYEVIARNRSYFGDFDPFGDFDLLLGAARANLKIVEVPVRYEARRYGETKISRFRHGWLLLKMSWFAFMRLKLR